MQDIANDSELGTLRLALPNGWVELGKRPRTRVHAYSPLARTWVSPTAEYPFRASLTAVLRADGPGSTEVHHSEETIELSNQLNDAQVLESTPWRRSFIALRDKSRLQDADMWSHAVILSISNENESVVWHLWTTRSDRTRVSVVLSRHWRDDLSDVDSFDELDSSLEFIHK